MFSKSAYTLSKVAQKKEGKVTIYQNLMIHVKHQINFTIFFPKKQISNRLPRIYIILSLLPTFSFKTKLLIENTRIFVQSALSLNVFCHWIFRNISTRYFVPTLVTLLYYELQHYADLFTFECGPGLWLVKCFMSRIPWKSFLDWYGYFFWKTGWSTWRTAVPKICLNFVYLLENQQNLFLQEFWQKQRLFVYIQRFYKRKVVYMYM